MLVDFLDGRGHDRRAIAGVVELQSHAASNIADFQHRAAPGRSSDCDGYRLRAELRMSPDQGLVISEKQRRIAVMLCLDLQDRSRLQFVQEDPALDLRLHNVAVHVITEIGVRLKQRNWEIDVHATAIVPDLSSPALSRPNRKNAKLLKALTT